VTTADMTKELCAQMHISVSELARRIGQTPQNFNKKLQRETVSLDELKDIADVLGVKFEQRFILPDGDEIKTGNSEEAITLDNNIGQVTEETLFFILDLFERMEVPYWLDGGWGVDVLTGQQNREHRDIDIDFDAKYTEAVISKLKDVGYVVDVDWMPSRMELKHDKYGYLDIHPIDFNSDGSITQADPQGGKYIFQKEWFTSTEYKGREIPCISKEAQLLFHSGYELTDKDHFDIDNLNSIQAI
jgi:lincosamide nucleotidyltransferase A/C/D/E